MVCNMPYFINTQPVSKNIYFLVVTHPWAAEQGVTGAQCPLIFVKNKKMCPFFIGSVPLLTLNDAVIYTCSHLKYINYLLKIYKN